MPAAALNIDAIPLVRLPTGRALVRVADATGAGTGDREAGVDLRLAQLLCARVCHDLIGAAGAIETGLDLLAGDDADRADIFDLIGLSGRQLSRRLAFYRLAFGMTGQTNDSRPLNEARRLAEGFLEGGRVTLVWQIDAQLARDGRLGGNETRLLLCAILVAADGLPRGGVLTVRLERNGRATRLVVEAQGKDATMSEATVAALSSGATLSTITARAVPAYYLGLQARTLAADLRLHHETAGFSLCISVGAC